MSITKRLMMTVALACATLGSAQLLAQEQPRLTPLAPELIQPPTAQPQSPPEVSRPVMPEDRPIGTLGVIIAPKTTELPPDVAAAHFNNAMPATEIRPWRDNVYFWDAPDFCYRPLYFQETNLERYGYTPCPHLQPAISAAHFFGATVALPYSMTVHPTRECVYPLGYYRPGSLAPRQIQWPELRPKAAAVEAGTVAGLILLIP